MNPQELRSAANEVTENMFAFPGTGIAVSNELAEYMGLDNGLSGAALPAEDIGAIPLSQEGIYYGS